MLFQRPGEKPVFYTSGLFQTADGEMAKSRMGEEEASLNNKQKKKIQVKECDSCESQLFVDSVFFQLWKKT